MLVCVVGAVASIREGRLIARKVGLVDSKESRLGCGHVKIFLRLVKVTARVLLGVKEIYACHF